MDIDKLLKMNDKELDELLMRESSNLMEKAPPQHKKRLQGLHWRIQAIKTKYKNNQTGLMMALYREMIDSVVNLTDKVRELNETLDTNKDKD
jgi:hypothetical protein